MRIEKHPYNYDVRKRFTHLRKIEGYAGSMIYATQKDDKFYIVIDDGTLADFLTDGDPSLDELVKVIEFDTEAEQQAYLRRN